MKRAYFNWSGGKDSALALWEIQKQKGIQIEYLLTSINNLHNRVSMHGVRRELLGAQAASLNIPLTTVELPGEPSMQQYESAMIEKIKWLKAMGITHSIFGDIFLEDLRKYREDKLNAMHITSVFPLWKINTKDLMKMFIESGFKAIIVCVNEKFLDKSFCGRYVDQGFCNELPGSVDVCGENGEFHTFVYDGPIFRYPISFKQGEIVYKTYKAPDVQDSVELATTASTYGFYFCDLLKV